VTLGEVAQTRMEPADRGGGTVANVAPLIGREPGVDGIPDKGRHRPTRAGRPLPQREGLVVGELDLHTSHVRTVAQSSIVMVSACVHGACLHPAHVPRRAIVTEGTPTGAGYSTGPIVPPKRTTIPRTRLSFAASAGI
jgi:hypothetical protein